MQEYVYWYIWIFYMYTTIIMLFSVNKVQLFFKHDNLGPLIAAKAPCDRWGCMAFVTALRLYETHSNNTQ